MRRYHKVKAEGRQGYMRCDEYLSASPSFDIGRKGEIVHALTRLSAWNLGLVAEPFARACLWVGNIRARVRLAPSFLSIISHTLIERPDFRRC
jgi:hypothetical protein